MKDFNEKCKKILMKNVKKIGEKYCKGWLE